MPKNGNETRTGIMDAAEELILDYGFAATAIDQIVEAAGVTKGAFFHHFRSKADLAVELVKRYAAADLESLEVAMSRAERLSRDPLQQLLIFLGLCVEGMEEREEPFPGCLYASYCYEAQLFDENTHEVIRAAMLRWRERVGAKIREVTGAVPARRDVDPESLADMLWVVFEGAFILSRTARTPAVIAEQLRQYRTYVELLFGVE